MVEARYGPYIAGGFKRYPSLKNKFLKKADYICKNPTELGEQLKYDLNGLRSFPLERNFMILFLVCSDCRRLEQQDQNNCSVCPTDGHEVVTFIDFGPHNYLYKKAKKSRDDGIP